MKRGTKRPRMDYSSPIVKILAGPREKPYRVHQDLVCAKSKFFATACSPQWNTTEEMVVRLPECHASIVEAFVKWVYEGGITIQLHKEQYVMPEAVLTGPHRDEHRETEEKYQFFTHLYILADKVDAPKLRNDSLGRLLEVFDDTLRLPCHEIVRHAFENLPEHSKLLLLHTNMMVEYSPPEEIDDGYYHPLVLKAMAQRWLDRPDNHTNCSKASKAKGNGRDEAIPGRHIIWDNKEDYFETDDDEEEEDEE